MLSFTGFVLATVLASLVLVDAQVCVFPAAWRRTWWEGDGKLTEFTATSPGVVSKRTNSVVTETLTCQNFFEPTDQWRYFVGSSNLNATNHQCKRVYQDTNLLVFMTAEYSGSTTQFNASVCADPDLYENTDEAHILVDDTPQIDLSCFTTLVGNYIATYSTSTADQTQQELCSDATETSRIYITSRTIVMNTCATGAALGLIRGNKTLTCLGQLPGTYIGQPTGSGLVALSDNSSNKEYYCSRIRVDTASQKVFLSIDMTVSGTNGLRCNKAVSAETAQPSPDLFVALVLGRLYCEPSHSCLNGGTCVEPVNPVGLNPESYTCTCPPLYTGNRCQTFLWCVEPTRCTDVSRGTCVEVTVNDSYTCTCNNGFTGQNCETELVCITRNPCLNGATCNEAPGDVATCTCLNGFTGLHCETRLVCVLTPGYCQNGGTCLEAPGDVATCACPNGYTGDRCQTALVCVLQSPYCQNGATCNEGPGNTATCTCPNGFTGDRCQTRLICVLQSPYCSNGGTCIEGDSDTASCVCPSGYTGDRCETALICALQAPYCQNGGACVELPGDVASCTCPVGFTGDRCQTQLICVLRPNFCNNNGTCFEATGNTATCVCNSGFTGANCETSLICVQQAPYCQNNGVCVEGPGDTANCTCPTGYIGDRCQTALICVLQATYCANNGVCVEGPGDTASCTCPTGYTGNRCQIVLICVTQAPYCQNGGICNEAADDTATCSCPIDYVGDRCQTPLFCVPDPCQHGGTCNENTDSCECPANYTGNFCETYLHCSSNPCQNNQQCIEGTNTFRCNCTGPYEGVQCELDIRCQFPTRWLSTWFLNPTFALNFAVNQMYELPSPTATPAIATNTFNCESYKESALTQGVRYFARSNIRDIHTETCTKGFQSTHLFLHWEDQLIQDATPPTAEYCEDNANFSFMPDIYVKYPFDYSTGTCLDFAAGRYEVVYSQRIPNQGLCANNSASIAVISPNSIQFIVCEAGGVEAILRQTLDCVGRISSNFIDPATDEIIVFQVRGSVSQVSSFYCGRIWEDLNNRRLLLSLDLTPNYSQITCLTGISTTTAIDTPPARQIRAFNLKRVYCFSSPCMNGSTCVEHDGDEFTCTCAAGYTGQLCETALFCVPDPCQHGGTCNENTDSCECPANYTGNFCETYLHCSSNPCQNNQQCIEGTNTFRCNCTGPYEGVQCELDIRCQFPTRWLSTWFLNPTFALNFAVNQMYELPSPTATPAIATNTFNCESYKESALTQGVRYFARSNIRDIHTETCTKGFQTTHLFLHWEDQLIQDATPPTAEYCEDNANFSFMPDIYVKYPFDYSTGTCLDFAAGRYEVVYSQRIPNQGLCANNSASIAVISPNSIQFIVCEAGGVDAILRQTLDCVGRISSNFIDPATDEIIVFQVRGSVSQVSSFYCGRIWEDLNNRRLLLSLDLTPNYSQITCLTGISTTTAIDTPPARQIRAFNLKRVYCFSSPCMNGSTCVEHDGDEFTCTCAAGYTGQLCETDIDECRSNPCLNDGTCTDMDGAFVCTCPTGYYAVRCESYNPCIGSLPCQNGGACISEASNNYTCNCTDNFVGINCETEVFCYSHPCLNSGTCMDIPKNFQCDCPDNFIGTQCETELHCFSIPCQNAGLCQEVDPSETYTCTCRPNFTGLNCETRLYCVPQPCQHGGTCREVTNDYTCNCPLGFTGPNCETRLFCVSEPCQNGGTCTELSGTGYRCTCPATPITFTGTNCETRLYCTPISPCLNGGSCTERSGTVPFYICNCPLGFSGDNCTVEGDCAFPNSWIGNWYVQVNQYVEFTTNKIYYKSTPSETPQSSYHCEDFYASTGVGDWWFYVRSPLAAPTNEACHRVHRDNKVLIHFDGFNGAASDPPTAEQCEGNGSMANYPRTPVIMIRHPFDFTTTSCFAQYTGQYFAQVSALCGNPSMDMYTSKVTIADSLLTVDTCREVRTEPLFNTRLMCVGLIDARYIGDDLTDPVIILAEYNAPAPTGRRKRQTGSPDNFFCARIRNSLDDQSDPRIYLSIDITPRSAIECLEGYTALSTSPSSPTIRALELTPVFCQPSDHCLNGGTCREMNGLGYECVCLPFFTGINCETGSDGCANDPCLNNGNCTTLNMMGDYQCTCPARFTGVNCDTEIFCTGVVCQNGGTCTEQTGNYQCQCVAGYTGRHCDADINECSSTPCQNAGRCNNMVNSYSCTCVGGTSGVNCATIDGCFSNPCMNGATCRTTNTNGSYECTCVAGYTGSRCVTDINECASSPCVNGGTCLNRINSYECQCPSGYSGSTCQYINGCRSTPCQNGGTCTYNVTSTRDTYACQCTFEYTGTNCEARLWCAGVMCLNGGTCQAVTNNYTCLCAEDYIGRHCGEQVQAVVAEEEDEGFDWTIFAIVVGVIGGLIALAVFIGGIYCCLAMGREEPRKQQLVQSQPFVQAYPIVSPTYIAASPVSTLMAEQSNAQLGAITYTSGPSLYGGQMNVRNATLSTIYGRGGDVDSEHGIVAEPPPRISLRNGGGSYAGSRSAANSIRIMGANGTGPGAGILVNRQSMEPRTEGSLMGKLIDAEFRPYD